MQVIYNTDMSISDAILDDLKHKRWAVALVVDPNVDFNNMNYHGLINWEPLQSFMGTTHTIFYYLNQVKIYGLVILNEEEDDTNFKVKFDEPIVVNLVDTIGTFQFDIDTIPNNTYENGIKKEDIQQLMEMLK